MDPMSNFTGPQYDPPGGVTPDGAAPNGGPGGAPAGARHGGIGTGVVDVGSGAGRPQPDPAPAGTASGAAAGRRAAVRRASQRSAVGRAIGLHTVPGRLRLWAAAAMLAIIGLFAVTSAALGNASTGLTVMGREAGPQVVATSALYFALSDMDAQVAEVLLIGRERNLGIGRERALELYERRRAEANRAVRQASVLAGQDRIAQGTVDAVLDGLGRYERLIARAIVLDEQARHRAGPPPERVMVVYRQATDLMRLELLPKASNLTLDNAVIVRRTYEDKRADVLDGRIWAGLAGGVLIIILIGLQIKLARRFRRAINPPLALATALAVGMVLASFAVLSGMGEHLRTAKEDGFDPTLALSRARAMSHDASADESRYLIDVRWSDRYEQVYLDKSKHLLGVEATNTKQYVAALDGALRSYRPGGPIGFVGIYGKEMGTVRSPIERRLAMNVLQRYRQYQRSDRAMRDLVAAGKRRDAIVFRVSRTPGDSAYDFEQYDQAVVTLTRLHSSTFVNSIAAGEQELGWSVALPAATIGLVLLIVWGVRPRLREYR
jgi:hypothetical protein